MTYPIKSVLFAVCGQSLLIYLLLDISIKKKSNLLLFIFLHSLIYTFIFMNTKVIHTCLVGDYDDLNQPTTIDTTFDYICYSNDILEKQVGVWQILPIPFKKHKDRVRLSRYVKIKPHLVLPTHYEYSVWMDANLQIVDK